MTPQERIDAALDTILKASGSSLKHYTMEKTLHDMRYAMRKIMSDSYISGSNDCYKLAKDAIIAERERCAKLVEGWNTAITDKITSEIRNSKATLDSSSKVKE